MKAGYIEHLHSIMNMLYMKALLLITDRIMHGVKQDLHDCAPKQGTTFPSCSQSNLHFKNAVFEIAMAHTLCKYPPESFITCSNKYWIVVVYIQLCYESQVL